MKFYEIKTHAEIKGHEYKIMEIQQKFEKEIETIKRNNEQVGENFNLRRKLRPLRGIMNR
jgi:hypothetical protein